MTINIVFRSFTEITERTGAGTSVPRYVSPDHCTVVYRYTGYTAHPYNLDKHNASNVSLGPYVVYETS